MKIECVSKTKSGSLISVSTDDGTIVDTFDVPTQNGMLYCLSRVTSKFTRRLEAGIAVADMMEQHNIKPVFSKIAKKPDNSKTRLIHKGSSRAPKAA